MECPHLAKSDDVIGFDAKELKAKLKNGIHCSGMEWFDNAVVSHKAHFSITILLTYERIFRLEMSEPNANWT